MLYIDECEAYIAQGPILFKCDVATSSITKVGKLPSKSLRELFVFSRLGRRLARVGFHKLVLSNKQLKIINAHLGFYSQDKDESTICQLDSLVGSRPMAICNTENEVYYGEYRSNGGFDGVKQRTPIHVWKLNSDASFEPVWQFTDVRHIHAISFDSYTKRIWVTTGDRDEESALWYTDDEFKTLHKFVGGSQQYRAIQLLFTETHIYFGSDAPDEPNFIYRIHKETKELECLQPVAGPIFYAYQTGNFLFFSTAVEPSEVNTSPYAELWGSKDGNTWKRIVALKKDRWPIKYFQYGQILFPSGPGDGKHLWYTPRATEYDEKTFCIPLTTIFN